MKGTFLKRTLSFLFGYGLTLFLSLIGVKLDLALNSYVRDIVGWKWWNYITSHHALTVLYLNNFWLWFLISSLLGIILGYLCLFIVDD